MKTSLKARLVFLIFDFKIIKIFLEFILRSKTSVEQISALTSPLRKTAVVEHLKVVINYERNNIVSQTFLEKYQSADTPVSVLKRMNTLEAVMKIKYFLKSLFFFGVVA